MNTKSQKILESLKDKKVGVFCDDSNLYHSYRKYNYRLDLEKFRKFLEKICNLQCIHYHIAIPKKSDNTRKGTEKFVGHIKKFVEVKEKDLKYTPVNGKFIKKGDVDVEIVLDVVRSIDDLDVVIIISGDSDYLELKNYIIKDKSKNIVFWAFEKNMAWELKYCWHLYLDDFKDEFLQEFNIPRFK